MLPRSSERVPMNTPPRIQATIDRRAACDVQYFARHPEGIDSRLRELDEEWDIERVLAANSAGISLFGLLMAILGGRRWLLLPLAVQGFFLQHALQGWCPPIPLLRRMGVRTRDEIARERYALKAVRGDFRGLDGTDGGDAAAVATRALSATE